MASASRREAIRAATRGALPDAGGRARPWIGERRFRRGGRRVRGNRRGPRAEVWLSLDGVRLGAHGTDLELRCARGQRVDRMSLHRWRRADRPCAVLEQVAHELIGSQETQTNALMLETAEHGGHLQRPCDHGFQDDGAIAVQHLHAHARPRRVDVVHRDEHPRLGDVGRETEMLPPVRRRYADLDAARSALRPSSFHRKSKLQRSVRESNQQVLAVERSRSSFFGAQPLSALASFGRDLERNAPLDEEEVAP